MLEIARHPVVAHEDEVSDAPIISEARQLVTNLRESGVETRLMGGIAIAVRCPSATDPALRRPYGDIDLVTDRPGGRKLQKLMARLGYHGEDAFNALQGSTRLLFYGDKPPQTKVDIFISRVEMCHTIDLSTRLGLHDLTLSLADLLLLKLQIVELNEKDARDVAALVIDHELTVDDSGINAAYLAGLCGSDWGLWKTVTTTLERLKVDAEGLLDEHRRPVLHERLAQLGEAIDAAPRTRRWKIRARVGERVRWYEIPEEVDR
jgi:hypothetical protein